MPSLLALLLLVHADYTSQVKPLLTARCYACHGALKQEGGLRLDTVAAMKKGGDTGPALVAGKSGESLLVLHVAGKGRRRMPPRAEGEPLKKAEIALLAAWIDAGAIGPADERPEADPQEHWAFRPPVRPPLPAAQGGNPIDAFLAARRDKIGVKPRPEADRRVLLRRVTLGLTGLPPTLSEMESFLADRRPGSYERAVKRLLASPRYGERWGRHWMDVWRYSDWWGLGAEMRNSQKHIWHWRDWIIESINADAGYDDMVRDMLAADELHPADEAKVRATGFLARSYFKFSRNTWLEEVTEHTAKAFLGLTINCAKCHDHKYDPIAQEDFYRFRAFFEPYQIRLDMASSTDFEKDGIPRVFDCNLDRPTYLFIRGDEKNPRKRPLSPGLPAVFASRLDIRSVTLPPESHSPSTRPTVLAAYLRQAEEKTRLARAALDRAKKTGKGVLIAEKVLAASLSRQDMIRAAHAGNAKVASQAERTAKLAEAEAAVARAEAGRDKKKTAAARASLAAIRKTPANGKFTPLRGAIKTLESNVESEASRSKPFPKVSSGRRSALANWIAGRGNPLTARVAVNHIWTRHFGTPLVATMFDFGRKGARPTHPELLDWLAVELMESGWSMKHIHELIVTSNAYRMSSASARAEVQRRADPENKTYWRMNSVRMEAEAIRDGLLHLAGDLDQQIGGPPVQANAQTGRRSLYFFHSHNVQNKFLSIFDDANVLECYRRSESILPQQALALQNSKLALAAAERIAARIVARDDASFARAAFEAVLCQKPSEEELAECLAALKVMKRDRFVHALLNHNDFVTIR